MKDQPAPSTASAPGIVPTDTKTDSPPEQLKIVIVGHVDHGKSTLVGRLLHETGSLPEGKLEQLKQVAARRGMRFEWANLTDALQAERDQNVTVETAHICFRTAKRNYVLIDAPGHKEFLKNMVTGATQADAALLVINASEGVQEQSRRHGYLLHLIGVRQLTVVVNQMDLVGYAQDRFHHVQSEFADFLKSLGMQARSFIPVCARDGDNLAGLSKNMPWWQGQTVVEALDTFEIPLPPEGQPLRFPIQDVYRLDHRRIVAGRVESGTLKVGDKLVFSPGHKVSTVKTIERWNAPDSDVAVTGESIGITLTDPLFLRRGAIGAPVAQPPLELVLCKARMFWLGHAPFQPGKTYKLKLVTQELDCEIEKISQIIDSSTLEAIPRTGTEQCVRRHEVAEVILRTRAPLVFDVHAEISTTGRFVIMDEAEICGGGIILEDNYPRRTPESAHKSQNIFWSSGKISTQQRAVRQGHGGCVLWLTGLSGSGKSTIATELESELFRRGKNVYVLDGDNVRHGLCADLGFSPEERRENIRRIAEVAKLFADAGIICITAFISPYRVDRETARKAITPLPFLEVYVNAPLSVCEQRDPKGLYVKARANKIKEFTGISAPYEAPMNPEIELNTAKLAVPESVAKLVEAVEHATGMQGSSRSSVVELSGSDMKL